MTCRVAASSEPGCTRFLLSEGSEQLGLSINERPIPRNLVETSVEGSRQSALPSQLDDRNVEDYMDNRAHIVIENTVSRQTGRMQSAFAVQILLTILKEANAAIGYNAISAMMYRAKEPILALLNRNPKFDATMMFNLLGSMHAIRNGRYWIHTHGMEQFGLPDIEVRFDDEGQRSYFINLLGNAAAYMIHQGRVLKVGDTSEMAGDGVVFRIASAQSDSQHQFGVFGAVAITEK
jgi:Domain of unknown function (DUF4261)